MLAIASKEEAKELRALVHAGRLFDVQAWLEAGKPFRTNRPSFIQSEPCVVAVKTGFFSMVECFVRYELTEQELNTMLSVAVQMQRPDLSELLLNRGADVHAVNFSEVLLKWQPEVIRSFLRHGADHKEYSPFAEAFRHCCRTSISIFKDLLRKERKLISQANEALLEHVRTNNRKWVDLMLWLGADPRAEVVIDDERTTALIEAAKYGRPELLKRFKVDPKRDDLIELIVAPAAYLDLPLAPIGPQNSPEREAYLQAQPRPTESMEYLLSFGPDLRQLSKSGRPIMAEFFLQMGMERSHGFYSKRLIEYVLCLAKHGSHLEGDYLWCVREALRGLNKQDQLALVVAIAEAKVLTPKALKTLVSTPAMRELLNAHATEKRAINEIAGIRSIDSMIVNLVREQVSSTSEIAARIGISQTAVNRWVARLIQAGRLAQKKRGIYKLGPNANSLGDELI